ncbi:hypothetical protein AB8Q18_01355 [Neisseriaceae bacterium CLB008]
MKIIKKQTVWFAFFVGGDGVKRSVPTVLNYLINSINNASVTLLLISRFVSPTGERQPLINSDMAEALTVD